MRSRSNLVSNRTFVPMGSVLDSIGCWSGVSKDIKNCCSGVSKNFTRFDDRAAWEGKGGKGTVPLYNDKITCANENLVYSREACLKHGLLARRQEGRKFGELICSHGGFLDQLECLAKSTSLMETAPKRRGATVARLTPWCS